MRYIDADSIQYASGSIGGVGIANITFKKNIDAVPSADVVQVIHAHWVGTEYDGYADGNPVYFTYECSHCGDEIDTDGNEPNFNYCPYCGAKMDGGKDNE